MVYLVIIEVMNYFGGYVGVFEDFYVDVIECIVMYLDVGCNVVLFVEGDLLFYSFYMYLYIWLMWWFNVVIVFGVMLVSVVLVVVVILLVVGD